MDMGVYQASWLFCIVLGVVLMAGGCDRGKSKSGPSASSSAYAFEKAPGGEVIDTAGRQVELSSLWADKKVILVFYRGHW